MEKATIHILSRRPRIEKADNASIAESPRGERKRESERERGEATRKDSSICLDSDGHILYLRTVPDYFKGKNPVRLDPIHLSH